MIHIATHPTGGPLTGQSKWWGQPDMPEPMDYPGMGQWRPEYFRVLYAPTCENLHTHHIVNEDGSPATQPAERIIFHLLPQGGGREGAGLRLLGPPYIEEVRAQMPGRLSLLQVDESDRWGLNFYDCGTLNFLLRPDDLRAQQWDKTECYLFSF